jgi:ferritin-like metal-binding protein YciE
MTHAEEHLMDWLRDARAMEEQSETLLESQIDRLEHYPHLKERLREHLVETRRQSELIARCIERRGGSTSTVKETMGKIVAMAQSVSGIFVSDEVVKGALAMHTFEQMEVQSYRTLIAAAEHLADAETAAVCRQILEEEEAMADWLNRETGSLVTKYLKRDEISGVEAKH